MAQPREPVREKGRRVACERCDELRAENTVLRDALEGLAIRQCEAQGRSPHTVRGGLPLWMTVLPANVRALWRGGARGRR